MSASGEGQAGPGPSEAPGNGGMDGDGDQAKSARSLTGEFDSGVGGSPVGPWGITLLAIVIFALLVLAVYCLIAVWPTGTGSATTVSHVLRLKLTLDREQRLFVVVGVTGALGGLIHSLRSLYGYVGNRGLRRSWLLSYLSHPFIGGALAVVFYVILRGGLVTGTAAQVNFFGFAAISALVGLFASEAAEKLKLVFSMMLASVPHERDSLTPGTDATAYRIEPRRGPPGTVVTIYGRSLSGTTAVIFGSATASPGEVTDAMVQCRVPAAATSGRPALIVGEVVVYAPRRFGVTTK
jgi:hypothetical protein